jgi:hypothetical protein
MSSFRPPKERIDLVAARILAGLKKDIKIELVNPNVALAIIRRTLTDNLKEEFELEQEVQETLSQHGQEIYEQGADFQKMLLEGKKMLARKKGFTL